MITIIPVFIKWIWNDCLNFPNTTLAWILYIVLFDDSHVITDLWTKPISESNFLLCLIWCIHFFPSGLSIYNKTSIQHLNLLHHILLRVHLVPISSLKSFLSNSSMLLILSHSMVIFFRNPFNLFIVNILITILPQNSLFS